MIVLMVAFGAAVGAPARYVTDRAVQSRHGLPMPWGTFTVNVVASFVLGIVIGATGRVSPQVSALIGTGFCGALSTFSTFSFEIAALARGRHALVAVAYVAISLIVGIAVAVAGWAIGSA